MIAKRNIFLFEVTIKLSLLGSFGSVLSIRFIQRIFSNQQINIKIVE